MYPKPVPDLVGWKVRDVSCSYCSIVCVADESVISWGPSPTYGELVNFIQFFLFFSLSVFVLLILLISRVMEKQGQNHLLHPKK